MLVLISYTIMLKISTSGLCLRIDIGILIMIEIMLRFEGWIGVRIELSSFRVLGLIRRLGFYGVLCNLINILFCFMGLVIIQSNFVILWDFIFQN